MRKCKWLAFLFYFLVVHGTGQAQFYFGKNKVQYTQFDWQVLKTDHFEVYFYPEEEELAQLGARVAEEAYATLRQKFNHQIFDPIPFIVYSSPHYFVQTNVVPGLLPENVAGFTEFIKGRMVIPFDGSYSDFAHVIRHELVHVFQMDKLSYLSHKYRKINMSPFPLWFTEGIAEFWSKPWDSQADMILRDLVISGDLVSLENMFAIYGSYLMYKEGESFCHFIADTYGEERLTMLFDEYWRGKDFTEVTAYVTGRNISQLGKEWEFYLKKKFFPDLNDRELPDRSATQLTRDGFNLSPVVIPLNRDGKPENWIAFTGNKRGYSTLYLMPPGGESEELHTLIKGERSADFESLHLMKSRISANRNGEIAFASKSGDKDVLYVYDIYKRKITASFEFPSVIGISSPCWSPSGDEICFAGVEIGGFSDLYIWKLSERRLTPITDDIYQEKDPAWSPDGNRIIFSSDRGSSGQQGYLNLYSFNLETGAASALTVGNFHDLNPAWSPDGRNVIFTSDRDGAFNLYAIDSLGIISQLTSFLTGAFDPCFSPDHKNIVFSGYQNAGFQLYSISLDSSKIGNSIEPQPVVQYDAQSQWEPEGLALPSRQGSVKYQKKFSFDLAQSAVAYDAFFGTGGGFQAAVSDMLGNHQYVFILNNSGDTKDDFLSSFNLAVVYTNRTRRINYGYGVYHFYDRYFDDVEGDYEQRQYGAAIHGSYPFSKFQRLETGVLLRYSERDWIFTNSSRRALLVTNYLSWVNDNSLWEFTGPLEGSRINLTLGLTYSVDNVRAYNTTLSADLRKYFRLGKNSSFATRVFGYSSDGLEPQRLYLGGSWSLRGYSRRAFLGRHLFLSNAELRFPLIDNIYVGFPLAKVGFQAIRGALFVDAGKAWEENIGQLYGSMGFGARLSLGYLTVLRFDWAWTTDFHKINPGPDFDLFFGWNF
ncbi:MAG: hypothetical protein L0Y74_03280 [candidate division Zixibacteria bacterium]|nr:hypothetical protein [candidate division Zixibacteria bacterium]